MSSKKDTLTIGPAAKRELRRTLKRSTDPASTIHTFQRDHSLHTMMARALGTTPRHETDEGYNDTVESLDTDSVMTFLSHLGLSQYEIHKRISDTLLQTLEEEIRKSNSTEPLLHLLQACWPYVTVVPELRPVLWSLLRQLGDRTPVAVLQALGERAPDGTCKHAELFQQLDGHLKRLCWETDWDTIVNSRDASYETTLLYQTIHPIVEQYCRNDTLVAQANLPFVATTRERSVLTSQRRALTSSSSSTAAPTNNFLRHNKTDKATPTYATGKQIAKLRTLLSDRTGSSVSYRPKLLHALLSILMTQHALCPVPFLGGAQHLHCTLVADLLLSAGGSLPSAYHSVVILAGILDECVQQGAVSDEALVKIQTHLVTIFQSKADENVKEEEEESERVKETKKDESSNKKEDVVTTNAEIRQLNRLLTAGLNAMKEADPQNLFLNPVTDAIAPGYSKIIRKPMCILTMQENIAKNRYNNIAEWESDVNLMFKNCIDYNRGSAGQWFRGEAQRQGTIFRDEILPQAKRLFQQEIVKRSVLEAEAGKRRAEEPLVKPMKASSKKRKIDPTDSLPSMPALASMLLSDPFVVRVLLARVLRDLRHGVLPGNSIPAVHAVIPSVLQILNIARSSTQVCASRGRKYYVPDAGIESSKDAAAIVSYASLRQILPLLLRLLTQAELQKRVTQGGELCAAAQVSPRLEIKPISAEHWKGVDDVQVVAAVVSGAIVLFCQPGSGYEAAMVSIFPHLAASLQALSSAKLEPVFLKCLLQMILRHRAKLQKSVRDVIVQCWMDWMRGTPEAMTSATHEYYVKLLAEWSLLGNLLLPRDTLVEFLGSGTDAASVSDKRSLASLWNDKQFHYIRTEYERVLKILPDNRAAEWKRAMKIEDAAPEVGIPAA
ncbi:bromodomain-containing protein 7/9 [Fistulifera solaris]|uniref:Bromodomain-containing protein 7/9 n=1 Tax=Fistulifera solaris TaxID=1519565 RepID=A0A1Z5J7C6_FISSO|nr:bromodomain-containing protein 7/9 [Fistulifera solaris]|eukprot:GAX09849.1 bromodomain-containing protein 7/9 [Fistulifera solaris]